ncbi:MAG TPA: hypothetical protein VJB35_06650 [Candidatus Nanoarchaeia archaeon]|nr:hypothetical protein [Candidatus Nanoarchaeia archaeon]
MYKIFVLGFATIIIWGNILLENPAMEESNYQEIYYYNHGI